MCEHQDQGRLHRCRVCYAKFWNSLRRSFSHYCRRWLQPYLLPRPLEFFSNKPSGGWIMHTASWFRVANHSGCWSFACGGHVLLQNENAINRLLYGFSCWQCEESRPWHDEGAGGEFRCCGCHCWAQDTIWSDFQKNRSSTWQTIAGYRIVLVPPGHGISTLRICSRRMSSPQWDGFLVQRKCPPLKKFLRLPEHKHTHCVLFNRSWVLVHCSPNWPRGTLYKSALRIIFHDCFQVRFGHSLWPLEDGRPHRLRCIMCTYICFLKLWPKYNNVYCSRWVISSEVKVHMPRYLCRCWQSRCHRRSFWILIRCSR